MNFHSALLTLSIFIPKARSLKDRRAVVQSLKEKIRRKFNVSVIEGGDNQLWQRATLLVGGLGSDYAGLSREFEHILDFAEQQITGRAQLLDYDLDIR